MTIYEKSFTFFDEKQKVFQFFYKVRKCVQDAKPLGNF